MSEHKIYDIFIDWKTNIAYDKHRWLSEGATKNALANGYYRESSMIYYFKDGKVHREDGPAIEHLISDYKEWRFNGIKIDCNSQQEFEKIIKLLVFI